jgi:branched-chain amino acid transport system substrate-binding protein
MELVRNRLRATGVLVAIAATLLGSAACGSSDRGKQSSSTPSGSANTGATAASTGAAAPGTPIKIGVLAPTSGVLGGSGTPIKESVDLWLNQHGKPVAGHPVELYAADTKSTVDGAVAAARSLVEQDHVSVVLGLVNSAGALAVRNYLTRSKVLALDVVANTDALLDPTKGPYMFVMPPTPKQTAAAAVALAETLKYKSVDVVADNFAGARSRVDPLVAKLKQNGGTIVSAQYPPFPTSDYGAYISRVQSSAANTDAVVALMYGGDALAFLKQYRSFNVTLPLYSVGAMLEPTSTLLPATKGTADGMYTYWNYSPALPSNANETFVGLYKSGLQRDPGAFDMQTYTALDLLAAAYTAAGGDDPTTEQLANAMTTVRVDSPAGEVGFNADHGIDWSMYLMRVVKSQSGSTAMIPQGPYVPDAKASQSVADATASLKQLPAAS